jgi:hypothetical protein
LLNLVDRARRRFLNNELIAQGSNAACAALVAFILLLLVGTQILDWRFTLVIGALAIAFGIYRANKRVPSPYAVAQTVDRRLGFADAISTAFYFSQEPPPAGPSPELRAMQLEQAARMAESADVRVAVPYRMPRSLYVVAVLLLVAGTLFALRYGLSSSLDLKAPLATLIPYQFPWQVKSPEQAKKNPKYAPNLPDPENDAGSAMVNPDQEPAGVPDPTIEDNPGGKADPSNDKSTSSKGQPKDGKKGGQGGDSDQEAQAEKSSDPQSNDANQQGNNKSDSKQQSSSKQDQNGGENPSLMNKMKDMFQNLLSTVKPPQSNPSNQQQNSDKQQGKGQQNAGKQEKSKDGKQENNGNPGDAQEGQQGEQAKSQQDPQGQGAGKSDSPQPSKQPGSGVGNQDGDKTIKQAEDQAAMGKITELFGKRSATITGEATVEVQNTSQQLHTAYSPRGAEHVSNGAQINRDEIPVAMQPYVQQYFEQLRKQTSAPAPVKKQ